MVKMSVGVPLREGAMALALGLCAAAAFPPIGIWPLSLVSISLFLRLLRNQDAQTARNIGLVYGVTAAVGTMYWFAKIFGVQMIPLVGIMTAYFGLLATLIATTRNYGVWLRSALVAMFALSIEWLRGDAWYLRFPWYTPTHALAAEPTCLAGAHWLGAYGLSYVIWFIACAGAFGRPWAWLLFLVLPGAALLLPAIEQPNQKAMLMQGEEESQIRGVVTNAVDQKVDLTVLPELAFMRSPLSALTLPYGPGALARRMGSPVIYGAIEGDYSEANFGNVAGVVDRQGLFIGMFQKQRPVPLMHDGAPGTTRPVFPMDGGVIGIGICYDFDSPAIAASLVRSGATVLVVPTYDAMSWSRIQHVHHEMLLRLRAIECGRWVLRAASSGRTEVINPHGEPSIEGIAIGETGSVVIPFAHRSGTPLGVYFPLLGPAAAAGTLMFALIQLSLRLREFGRKRSTARSET